ncbi:uncharacterized protein [Lepeophtheirus salmonis]|uniref:Uncharacterized protein C14orf118 homolog [Acyrthosiphon pisum] n=2 Tax=Lepeophtheirus salmonis TaxID=72036 RepID=A0A0K2U0N7_LEPSM|nr:uncharacterized protein LOC121127483 isoform X1 [Lepeophtheirus salmonis]XP_040578796.1 uncharacterized protein LOC121127483 isoform X1 [Lepeophtheirus salmonis]XP_040578797.1 uncharacterized protein LOC121127483 isoform X1 [Lepeophtheirus salmonis]XP_040578798.1 uncharacterized protein LOC121127483 isoform X1 [Lepeophtheirus salmonis]
MEGLAHDLNSALEESTASSSHKRKSWKRRKKKNEDSSDSSSSLSSSSENKIPQVLRNSTRKQRLDQESDSFNESKNHHPRPKRKRKCKRLVGMAIETKPSQKRKKIRTISSEMKCIRPGKRPRSTSSPMDLDEDESSSSYDEEDDEEEDEEDFVVQDHDDRGQEADDEQSDWPGINEDLDEEPIRIKRIPSKIDNKRNIRAGTRRNVHIFNDCLLNCNDLLSKFLQDSSRIELEWSVRDFRDRNKIVQFANLYSLNLKFEDPFTLRLTKTCNTVQLNNKDGLFLIPGAPSSSLDFKRRRKTPPIFEPTLDDVRSPQRDSQSPASKRRTNYYDGSRSS